MPAGSRTGEAARGALHRSRATRRFANTSGRAPCARRNSKNSPAPPPTSPQQLRECQEDAPPTEFGVLGARSSSAEERITPNRALPAQRGAAPTTRRTRKAISNSISFSRRTSPASSASSRSSTLFASSAAAGWASCCTPSTRRWRAMSPIKVIDPQLANNEVARPAVLPRGRAAAAVTHDNLVAVHQVNEDEPSGLPYLVMQSGQRRIARTAAQASRQAQRAGSRSASDASGGRVGRAARRRPRFTATSSRQTSYWNRRSIA